MYTVTNISNQVIPLAFNQGDSIEYKYLQVGESLSIDNITSCINIHSLIDPYKSLLKIREDV